MPGRFCTLVPAEAGHAADLHAAFAADRTGALWTYMAHGPHADAAAFAAWLAPAAAAEDPLVHAILVDGRPLGIAAFMRIEPAHGVIEIGGIVLSPALQRTPAATEALHLMAARAFDALGYRRLEWKCDALNAPSRRAALRLGFAFEGIFRNHMVVKGRSRDTAWFAMTDADWPAVRAGTVAWLAEAAADAAGRQRRPLAEAIAAARAAA
jgi:RimJ/RimL family protein N-acetyltransferase